MNEIAKLREKRAALLAAANEYLQRAKARPDGQNDLTDEESAKVDEIYAEFDAHGRKIETLERMTRHERATAELAQHTRRSAPAGAPLAHETPGDLADAVRTWFLRASGSVSAEDVVNAQRCGIDLNAHTITIRTNANGTADVWAGERDPIRRDLITTSGTSAMTSYREFTSKFELYQKFYGRALDLVTILPTDTGVTLPIPRFDDTNNKGRWLAEAATVTNTDPTPTSITLGAYKASSDEVPLSVELLQDGQVAMGNLVPMLLGERIGRLKNEAVTVGTGSSQPYGIMTRATASGVVLAGTNASPTYDFDKFLDLKYSVDVAYRNAPAAKRGFMLADAILAKLRKLKDGNSRYLADPFTNGPGTIDGDPIHTNNDVATTGISAKVAAYGDFSKYLWREVAAVTFMRLNEIRAREGKVVFMAWCRSDGDLINTSAVKTLANPAS